MKTRIRKCLSAIESRLRLPLLLAFGLLGLLCAGVLVADEPKSAPDLTAHEWGTFTSIAGNDGNAMQWQTLRGSTDLPGFVEHFSDGNFKSGLRGTIRMETPVLYFYSPREATVSVHVAFSKGVITEWYPHAAPTEPSDALRNTDLRELHSDGSITWSGVSVSPELIEKFPRQARSNHYYAARETASTPLSVKTKAGDQQEKFLFYRGVSAAPLPLSAVQEANGDLLVKSLDESEIPAVILFERRGERIGYRFTGATADEVVLQPPDLTGNLESLLADLERLLVDQGLYPDEAHSMVETWRDSWFEEGSRVIYIVPRSFVDSILPLRIEPAPSQIVRVFVGRLEIVTPTTVRAVKTAFATHDETMLNKYGRFLEPILQVTGEPAEAAREIGRRH
jgi:hypothetical protein